MRMSDLIQLSDFFLPYFFAIKEGLHGRSSSADFFSRAVRRRFMDSSPCRSQMDLTPEGDTNIPFLRSSLLFAREMSGQVETIPNKWMRATALAFFVSFYLQCFMASA